MTWHDFETPIVGGDEYTRSVKKLLGLLDTPAYLRRAQRVNAAIDALRGRCAAQRDEWLEGVRIALRQWNRLAASDPTLESRLSGDDQSALDGLRRMVTAETSRVSPGRPRAVWRELASAIERFNNRWDGFVRAIDPGQVNAQIADYNRYYLVEKECALGSGRLAARGYVPMPCIDISWLFTEFPALPTITAELDSTSNRRTFRLRW